MVSLQYVLQTYGGLLLGLSDQPLNLYALLVESWGGKRKPNDDDDDSSENRDDSNGQVGSQPPPRPTMSAVPH